MAASTYGFGTALGVGAVALPLLALVVGYDPSAVGFLAATSAVAQLGIRLALPTLLARFPDRTLVGIACLLLALSYGLLLVTTVLPVFLLAHALQGAGRGIYWTGSQTHAIRGSSTTVRSLAQFQTMANLGTLSGPALGGALAAISLDLALIAGSVVALAAAALTTLLRRLPPFERQERGARRRLWREPDVLVGCLANFTAGGWRSLLGSYVPVILSSAGLGPGLVGILVSFADAASMGASALLAPLAGRRVRLVLRAAVLTMGAAIALLPLAAGEPALAGAIIFLGGVGSGLAVVLGPSLVADAVRPHERGEGLALSGQFRSVALLIAPAGVAVTLSVIPLGLAMAVMGFLVGVPPALIARRAGRPRAT